LRPTAFRLPGKECPFGIGESDALAVEALLQQSILGLKELDDDQLLPMDPAGYHHQQESEKRRHGTHAQSLSQASAEYLDSTGLQGCPRVDLSKVEWEEHAHSNKLTERRSTHCYLQQY